MDFAFGHPAARERARFALTGVRALLSLSIALSLVIAAAFPSSLAHAAKKRSTKAPVTQPPPPTIPPAVGPPVLVGWISGEPNGAPGAALAEKFVNAHGGVSGRPLKIVPCLTKGTPASAKSCANQLISKGIKIVVRGEPDAGWSGAAEVFAFAKLLVIGASPNSNAEANDPNSIYLAPPSAIVTAATGVYALSADRATAVTVIVSSNAAVKAGLPLVLGSLRAGAITPLVITLPKAPPDPTTIGSVIATAVKSTTDNAVATGGTPAVIALLSPDQCVGVMQAVQAQAFVGKLVSTDTCASQSTFDLAGTAADNWVFVSARPSLDRQPQLASLVDYAESVTKYKATKSSSSIEATFAFSSVIDAASLLSKLEKSVLNTAPVVVGATLKTYLNRAEPTSTYSPIPYVYKRSTLFPSVANFTVYAAQRSGSGFITPASGTTINAFLG